jgi:hypothetical protein
MKSNSNGIAAIALGVATAFLAVGAVSAAEVTELKITRDTSGDRYHRDANGTKWVLHKHNGYRIITNCGLRSTSGKGPSQDWDYAPLDDGTGAAGYIESEDQCHRLMGHQRSRPDLANKMFRGNSGDWNWYIDRSGNKHAIHSRAPAAVWQQCGLPPGKSQVMSFDEIFRINGQNEIKDLAGCVAVTGKR